MLADRRVRGDLIEMYISVNGLDEIHWERNPIVNTPKVGVIARSNGLKIRRTHPNQGSEMIMPNRNQPDIIIS